MQVKRSFSVLGNSRARRVTSVAAAAAIASMLVLGSGAAYGDDGAGTAAGSAGAGSLGTPADPPATDTPKADPPADPPKTDAPADPPATEAPAKPAATPKPDKPVTTPTITAAAAGASKPKTLAKLVSAPIINALTINCLAGPGTVVGGFEIDGDTCVDVAGNKDWDNTGQSVVDGLGDSTTFHGGVSEGNDPATWTLGGPAPNGKTDIETAWAWSQATNGTVYGYFGISNDSTSGGTSQYDVEYNQADPVGGMPNRTPGDLLFRFNSTGNAAIQFTDAKMWRLKTSPSWNNGTCQSVTATAGWCTIPIPPMAFDQQTNTDGTFFEGAINIGLFFGNGTCSGDFGVVNIRSVTGNSFYSSSLKDYVTPLGVDTPSTCGKIVINKQDTGNTPLGGATFSVSPNPDPAQSNNTPYSITDNGPKDQNPAVGVIEISPVDPGDAYTVTETAAPAGYLLASPASQGPTVVGASQTVTFTFHDPKQWQALTASKTANPTYTAQYAWSLVKEIATSPNGPWFDSTSPGGPLTKNVSANGNPTASDVFYRVTATEGARTTSGYKVSGTIHVDNPNNAAVTADIGDALPGASCLVAGDATHTVAVPAGGADYPYVCTFAGTPAQSELAGTNTATVSWDKSDYPQTQADVGAPGSYSVTPSAPYAFGAETTSINKTVTITDDQHVFNPAQTFTWSQQGTTHTTPTYSHTLSTAPGTCSPVFANSATLTGDGSSVQQGDDQVLGTDSAYGKLCVGADLDITHINARGFTRTFPWAVQKATTTPKVTVVNGAATAHYEVTVTAGQGADSDWVMGGTVTVHNPNGFESVDVTSLPVTYSGGGTCTVADSFPFTLAAGASHDFAYTCNFASQPAYSGTVDATVHWDAAAAHTPNSSVADDKAITEADWTKALVNDTVTVHDDHAAGADDVIATLDWATVFAMPNHRTVIGYDAPLQDLPDGGTCADKVNTVWVVGDGDVHLDSDQNAANNSATVKVCNPIGLSVTNSNQGDFSRTYHWKIDKFINADQKSQTVHIDAFDHTFDYKVVATPQERVDGDWVITGTIGVHNDNTDAAIDPITVTGVTEIPNVGAVTHCDYDTTVPFDLASNASKNVGFTCTVDPTPDNNGAEPPVYGGTTKAHVTWGASASKDTAAQPVSWNAPTETDKTIAVYDNKVGNVALPVLLGNAVWNAAGTPTVFDYQLDLSVPEDTAGSCAAPFDNTAWLGGNGINPTQLQSSAEAVICVNAGTWAVSKVNIHGDGPIPVDSDVTYRLTAHKTGGVNPKNVVLHDDLSDIAPFITGTVDFTAPAGTTVDYDASTHLLTWTIAELDATDRTLDFTVHVKPDAFGADLPNLVTSPGSDNCPNADVAVGKDECTTDNDTPHYTLAKASSVPQGGAVMPPYLGAPGSTITYTLTVTNDSDAEINPTTLPGAAVTDDLSAVLDDAHFVAGSIDPAGQAELNGDTLTWTLPVIPAGQSVQLHYQVQVDADQWDQTLTNVASTGSGGDCVPAGEGDPADANCTTTSVTPPYTQLSVVKVDFETGEPLAGAEFALFRGEDQIDTATSGADGVAVFGTKLQPGDFTVKETKAPDGYDLPVSGGDTVPVTIQAPGEGSNFVPNGVMAPITFRDPATGQLAIVSKQHFERDPLTNDWIPSDGAVDFGQEVRYVVTVKATGTRLFHNVTVKDYVPGFNPLDTTTNADGVLEAGSSACGGDYSCTSTEDAGSGLVTWTLASAGEPAGTVKGGTEGTAEFVIRMPDLPANPPFVNGVYDIKLWNVAYLDWDQVLFQTEVQQPPSLAREALAALDLPTEHESLTSNEVIDEAKAFEPAPPIVTPPVVEPPTVEPGGTPLPNTGGPDLWVLLAGLALALGGTALVLSNRRHWRRS